MSKHPTVDLDVVDTLRRTIETVNLAMERGDKDGHTGGISYSDSAIGSVIYERHSNKADNANLVQTVTVDRFRDGSQSVSIIDYVKGIPQDAELVIDSLAEFNAIVGGSDEDDESENESDDGESEDEDD